MNEIIKESILDFQEVKNKVKTKIFNYLSNCDYNVESRQYQVVDLNNFDDIKKIRYGAGFYVILTSLNFADNESQFKISELTAIYRGHSHNVKDRIISHLFNTQYKLKEKKSKYPTNYTVCLKIEDGINGIDIDQKPYSEYNWKVVVHRMKDSTELIRQQTEHAFDDIYKKPIKSREKK